MEDVDWNAELVDQLEWHWRYQLRPRLDGLTDDEFFWQPVPGCWTLSRRGRSSAPRSIGTGEFTLDCARLDGAGLEHADPPPGPAPVTTIAWRMAHLIDVFGPPSVPHFQVPVDGRPTLDYPGTAEAALRQLDHGYDAWVRDVRGLGAAGIARPQGELSPPQFADAPIAKLILHIHREVIHHGAEISLLRDLYVWKGTRSHV
ncbi:DinB family protein [Plantactinospora sp. KBS50]|uniref:DinB family protein n=1 Tax=Plantactinospora sp. KBS50 TaxID=2024580 RepID=UPI000BAACE24|nr:DinB family protein [Plantactinospora sp. KBS50]ASW55549.1 serine/arginine repetitive matrix protein 1 [Plantactinospora sp. KBS50]